jgi:hypothetical protein
MRILRRLLLYICSAYQLLRAMLAVFLLLVVLRCFQRREWR